MTTSQSSTRPFPLEEVRALPKAELHVHLEGTVDPATLLELAERHGARPPADTVEGVQDWYRFEDFPMFLERYFAVLELLREPEDFATIAERYLDAAHAQGAVHVELHVSATGHIAEGGKAWAPIHDGIVEGCQRAAGRTGISWGLIPDISPHLGAEVCAEAMEEVFAHDLDHVVAIGMGGPAESWPTQDFEAIYRRAESLGIPGVAHAAEHGDPWEVRHAVERFGARRIQHGIGVVDDPDVVALLVERGIPCDVAPGSNLALNAVASPAAHPLRRMLEAGITVTLASDDPPLFRTSLLEEYQRAWEWCDLDMDGMARLARNSIEHSFASDTDKGRWLARLA
ncbi:adenosine deaminase [Euzebya rosea]|uniref:adenosine deaminase n=1 Tax=Euzebya rosea TaxID=2052804 RepID=UPI0013003160|nr:adenosine deaminase [Euzebya rosea]